MDLGIMRTLLGAWFTSKKMRVDVKFCCISVGSWDSFMALSLSSSGKWVLSWAVRLLLRGAMTKRPSNRRKWTTPQTNLSIGRRDVMVKQTYPWNGTQLLKRSAKGKRRLILISLVWRRSVPVVYPENFPGMARWRGGVPWFGVHLEMPGWKHLGHI